MKILITGGCGFIGINTAIRFLSKGHKVVVFDNLDKIGSLKNYDFISSDDNSEFVKGDLRNRNDVERVFAENYFDIIFHLGGQTAVTTSIIDPVKDFESNALGTFYVLEGFRNHCPDAKLIFSSTNKIYGDLRKRVPIEMKTRYAFKEDIAGIDEEEPLEFFSPYACSNGASDQYVRDYARIYGLDTCVVRQSCIAGEELILTPFGKKKMKDLRIGDLVHSGYKWTKIKQIWKTGAKFVRTIRTESGLSVILTRDHKVIRPCGLVENSNFMYGDLVSTIQEQRFAPLWENVQDEVLSKEMYLRKIIDLTSDKRSINKAKVLADRLLPLTGDILLSVAEIVGRMFGDGNLNKCIRKGRHTITYTIQHYGSMVELEEVKERLNQLGITIPAIHSSASKSLLPNGHLIDGTSLCISQQSLTLFVFFELLGVPVGDKSRVLYEVPGWVVNGHRLVKRAFLRGFFGAELCQTTPKSMVCPTFAQSKDVDFIENGIKFVNQLRTLIYSFGIETSMTIAKPVKYKKGTTQQITVRLLGGKSGQEKLGSIGYAFSNKRSKVLNLYLKYSSTNMFSRFYDEFKNKIYNDGITCWDSISEIVDSGIQDVYDLEVDCSEHLFVAGGIQVSNCIYGVHQKGSEDQGWIAFFTRCFIENKPLTIFGNGKQVRDILYISDLVDFYERLSMREGNGEIYNIGGGIKNSVSLLELIDLLGKKFGRSPGISFSDERLGDQKIFISDNRKAEALGWSPKVGIEEGIDRLIKGV